LSGAADENGGGGWLGATLRFSEVQRQLIGVPTFLHEYSFESVRHCSIQAISCRHPDQSGIPKPAACGFHSEPPLAVGEGQRIVADVFAPGTIAADGSH